MNTTNQKPQGVQKSPEKPEQEGKPTPRQQQQLDERRDADAKQRQENEGGKQQR